MRLYDALTDIEEKLVQWRADMEASPKLDLPTFRYYLDSLPDDTTPEVIAHVQHKLSDAYAHEFEIKVHADEGGKRLLTVIRRPV